METPDEEKTNFIITLCVEYEAQFCKIVHQHAKQCFTKECEESLQRQPKALANFIETHAEKTAA